MKNDFLFSISTIAKAFAITALTLSFQVFFISTIPSAEAATTDNVSGWAWSENIGWISANCTDVDSCATSNYGINIDLSTGNVSGYAWSEHIGWISFNRSNADNPPLAPHNSGPGPIATYNSITGQIEGWARALAGCQSVPATPVSSCSSTGPGAAAGGWDGWIRLSGNATNGSPYRVTVDSATGDISGWAWGGDVVGWISFDMNVAMSVVPGDPYVSLTADPATIPATPHGVELTWVVENVDTCTASNDASAGDWTGIKDSADGTHSQNVIVASTPITYRLVCTSPAGEVSDDVTIDSLPPPPPPPPPPDPTPTIDIELIVEPKLIRSGRTATVKMEIDADADLTCVLRGAENNDIVIDHNGSETSSQSYSETTRQLYSTQVVELKCSVDGNPSYDIPAVSARVDVIPSVQEI